MVKFLKSLTPPVVWELGRSFYHNFMFEKFAMPGFHGDYANFEEALSKSTTYECQQIMDSAVKGLLNNIELSQNSDKIITSREQQLFSALAYMFSKKMPGIELKVLDVGGSTAAYYFAIKRLMPHLKISWTVRETETMVEHMKGVHNHDVEYIFEKTELEKKYDLVFMSGSLQYVEKPYEELEYFASKGEYFIITRTPLIKTERDRLAIQVAPPSIYRASYPAWFFSEARFVSSLEKLGNIAMRWDVPEDSPLLGKNRITYKGFFVESHKTSK